MEHPLIIQSAIGLIAVILFRYKNPHRDFINVVSMFVFTIFLSVAMIAITDTDLGFAIWVTTAVGLLLTYFLRFLKKDELKGFDYLKLAGLIALAFYPLSYYRFVGQLGTVEYYLRDLIIPILGTIYVYDRLILKTDMKKRFIIILCVQSVLILMMLTFSIYQHALAEMARQEAVNVQNRAIEMEKKYQELLNANNRQH